MPETFTRTITTRFHVVSCYTCGCNFGVGDDLHRRAVRDKKGSLYCPACGKETIWVGETEAKRLQRELQAERAEHDQTRAELETTERRRRAAKGQLTKAKNRISKGVCPCCNRHFENLQRHMETEHPEFATAETED